MSFYSNISPSYNSNVIIGLYFYIPVCKKCHITMSNYCCIILRINCSAA